VGGGGRREHAAARQRPAPLRFGNRQAVEFVPMPGVTPEPPGRPLPPNSPRCRTRRRKGGASVVVREGEVRACGGGPLASRWCSSPFSASTRMSGINAGTLEPPQRRERCGGCALGARAGRGTIPLGSHPGSGKRYPRVQGGTPARRGRAGGRARAPRGWLGVIYLKDVVKGGMRERFGQLRGHGHPYR